MVGEVGGDQQEGYRRLREHWRDVQDDVRARPRLDQQVVTDDGSGVIGSYVTLDVTDGGQAGAFVRQPLENHAGVRAQCLRIRSRESAPSCA